VHAPLGQHEQVALGGDSIVACSMARDAVRSERAQYARSRCLFAHRSHESVREILPYKARPPPPRGPPAGPSAHQVPSRHWGSGNSHIYRDVSERASNYNVSRRSRK
jgi:hypothetical protein